MAKKRTLGEVSKVRVGEFGKVSVWPWIWCGGLWQCSDIWEDRDVSLGADVVYAIDVALGRL
jgi:hypothetical protein